MTDFNDENKLLRLSRAGNKFTVYVNNKEKKNIKNLYYFFMALYGNESLKIHSAFNKKKCK